MKKLLLLSVLVFLLTSISEAKVEKTKVLTVGTIHQMHKTSKYSYEDIVRVLNTFKPDLICVEIRPEVFRKETYLREMMLATAYGDLNKIKVAPVDWYEGNEKRNDRTLRDSLMSIDRYKQMQKTLDSLESCNEIMKVFTAKYGTSVFKNKELGFDFWNGTEYNSYNRETYRLSISIFGDSPVNLHCITRNSMMTQRIKAAVSKYKAKRVVVLCGGEHKSFIDDSIQASKHFEIVSLSEVLPLKEYSIANVIEKERPSLYFTKVDSAKVDMYYEGVLFPYIIGQNMELNFSKEVLATIPMVGSVLTNWQADAPNSTSLKYIKAWVAFLNKDYDAAIGHCNAYLNSKDLDKMTFSNFFAYRLLGFCYDLKNDRTGAVECYKKAKEILVSSKANEKYIGRILREFETKPFAW